MTLEQKVHFFRSLSLLFTSGLHLVESLESLARSDDENFVLVNVQLCQYLQHGMSLHSAMARLGGVFDQFEIRLVEVGFATGSVGHALRQLALIRERDLKRANKLRGALIYPSFLLVGCLLMSVVLPPMLFGGIFEFLESLETELPIITRAVMGFSSLVRHPGFFVPCLFLVLISFRVGPRFARRPSIRMALYRFAYGIPQFGQLFENVAVSRFCYGLSLMLEQGSPLHTALPLSIKTTGDPWFENQVSPALKTLIGGVGLSESLEQTGMFSPLIIQAVRVGEESSSMDIMLRNVAKIVDAELESRIEGLIDVLEPLSLAIMGVFVGITTVAALLPLSQVLQSL